MNKVLSVLLVYLFVHAAPVFASEEHEDKGHAHDEKSEKKDDHGHDEKAEEHQDDHAKKDGHEHKEGEAHGDEHGEEQEEENSKVGPDKGILEANEASGFKLSPEAIKNFDMKTQKLVSQSPWELPLNARMFSQEEVNLFRVRNGFIRRIDFNLLSKTQSTMKVTSSELKEGDEIVVSGIGFIRIAELTAFGGAPEGHSH